MTLLAGDGLAGQSARPETAQVETPVLCCGVLLLPRGFCCLVAFVASWLLARGLSVLLTYFQLCDHRWEELEWPALEAVQELHRLSESHPENQRIIGRNKLVLEGVVHVLQNGSPKSKLWCCAVLVNLAYRSEENTAKIGADFETSCFVCVASHPSGALLRC